MAAPSVASWAAAALGETLAVAGGAKPVAEALAGYKYVALYFSASWCGPCRKFTPLLSVLYEDQPEDAADRVAVIFVSHDETAEEFGGYLADMPWPAVRFEDAARRSALDAVHDVKGIPRVVLLDAASGAVVERDARTLITTKKKLTGLF